MLAGATASLGRGLLQRKLARRALSSTRVQRKAGAREREVANAELDRRVGGGEQLDDGSGAWGAEADDRGATDRANWYMWSRVALVAESMGHVNAARHMRHYLGNTGATLQVSVDNMLRDVPSFRGAYDREEDEARLQVADRIRAAGAATAPQQFHLNGERRSDVYCDKGQSADWFYAIGGFTHWWEADVTLIPDAKGGPPTVMMVFTMKMHDRYNWDQGKAVSIAGITVTDQQLGRLHRVGLAQEFDVDGSATPRTLTWKETFTSQEPTEGAAPVGGSRDGGRSDPGRDRGNHYGNVVGSPTPGVAH